MKSKDVLEVLSEKGVALKSSSSLDAAQFELLFNTLTLNNQIDNIGNYLDGITYIPSKKKTAAPKPAKEETAAPQIKESKSEETQPKKTVADAEAPKTQKAQPKTEAKAEVKTEPKVEVKAEPKIDTVPGPTEIELNDLKEADESTKKTSFFDRLFGRK